MTRRSALALHRHTRGYTQETLAAQLAVDVSSVARWERGLNAPSPALRGGLAAALDLSLEELSEMLTASQPGRPLPDELDKTDVDRAFARIQQLRHLDDVLAGGDSQRLVCRELETTTRLWCTAGSRCREALLPAVAELYQLAAWCVADAGDSPRAQRLYTSGINAARQTGDQVLTAQLTSSLAYHHAENAMPAEAVALARSALESVHPGSLATPRVRALLYARLAWAHVAAGDGVVAAECIRAAENEFAAARHDDNDPNWIYWLNGHEMDIIVGRCQARIGDANLARHRLTHGLELCDPRHLREHTLSLSWLAAADLEVGDVASASRGAQRARTQAALLNSSYCRTAIRRLDAQLMTTVRRRRW